MHKLQRCNLRAKCKCRFSPHTLIPCTGSGTRTKARLATPAVGYGYGCEPFAYLTCRRTCRGPSSQKTYGKRPYPKTHHEERRPTQRLAVPRRLHRPPNSMTAENSHLAYRLLHGLAPSAQRAGAVTYASRMGSWIAFELCSRPATADLCARHHSWYHQHTHTQTQKHAWGIQAFRRQLPVTRSPKQRRSPESLSRCA